MFLRIKMIKNYYDLRPNFLIFGGKVDIPPLVRVGSVVSVDLGYIDIHFCMALLETPVPLSETIFLGLQPRFAMTTSSSHAARQPENEVLSVFSVLPGYNYTYGIRFTCIHISHY